MPCPPRHPIVTWEAHGHEVGGIGVGVSLWLTLHHSSLDFSVISLLYYLEPGLTYPAAAADNPAPPSSPPPSAVSMISEVRTRSVTEHFETSEIMLCKSADTETQPLSRLLLPPTTFVRSHPKSAASSPSERTPLIRPRRATITLMDTTSNTTHAESDAASPTTLLNDDSATETPQNEDNNDISQLMDATSNTTHAESDAASPTTLLNDDSATETPQNEDNNDISQLMDATSNTTHAQFDTASPTNLLNHDSATKPPQNEDNNDGNQRSSRSPPLKRRRIMSLLDLAAEDSGDEEEDEEEDHDRTLSDDEFIDDDDELLQGTSPSPFIKDEFTLLKDAEDLAALFEGLADEYKKDVETEKKKNPTTEEAEAMLAEFKERVANNKWGDVRDRAEQNVQWDVHKAKWVEGPRVKYREMCRLLNQTRVDPGDWIRLNPEGSEKRIVAFVVTPKRFIIPALKPGSDSCEKYAVYWPLYRCNHPVVHPSLQELEPFRKSRLRYLQRPSLSNSSYGLCAQEHVFIVEGDNKGQQGLIKQMWYSYRDTPDDPVRTHWARVRWGLHGLGAILASSLRRHMLDPGPPVKLFDRVKVRYGVSNHLDRVGRIVEVEGIKATVETSAKGRFQVDVEDLVRRFEMGDWVEVVWGAEVGRKGLVVSVDKQQGSLSLVEDIMSLGPGHHDVNLPMVNYFEVFMRNICFLSLADDEPLVESVNAFATAPVAAVSHTQSIPAPGDDIADVEQPSDTRDRQAMHIGKRFEGLEVVIGGTHRYSGRAGTIVGDHDSVARAQRLKAKQESASTEEEYMRAPWMDRDGILITVVEDDGSRIENLTVEDLFHRWNGTPLAKAFFVGKGADWSKPTLHVEQPLSRQLWAAPPPEAEGEYDGKWLCCPKFAGKRLDVQVKGTPALQGHRTWRLSNRILECENEYGYLLLTDAVKRL
ncbi:hypothetical protein FB45DRAFT_1038435 [Roridomyces roridus]|uniref:KOW domain-containing protein n=1 Tax=Roridomyces roridus TaxID=1738132 RepID=A0AAD7B4T6_9AGAR|nr:hypothetical protein FB45DRAFT_1038435 [Roridomyces roridus]